MIATLVRPPRSLALVAAAAAGAAVSIISPLAVLAGTIALAAAIAIWRAPFWGLVAVAALLPFEQYGSVELSGVTIRASHLVGLLLVAVVTVKLITRQLVWRVPTVVWLPLAAFFAVNVAGLVGAENPTRALAVLVFTAFTVAVGLTVPLLVTDRRRWRQLVLTVLVAATVVSLFGLFQFLGDVAGLPSAVTGLRELYTKSVFGFPRIQSTAHEPLYFANYLLLPLGFAFALFARRRSTGDSKPLLLILFLLLAGTNLVLTVSRGGYVAAAALIVVIALVAWRSLLTTRNILILLAVVLIVLVVAVRLLAAGDVFGLNVDTFLEHVLNSFSGASYNERVATFELALTAWYTSPVVGIGPGGFGPFASFHPYVQPMEGWKIVNNEFLELLAETGMIGLTVFVLFLALVGARAGLAIRRSRDHFLAATLVGALAALIATIVQYQTFSTLYILHVWFLIGVLIAGSWLAAQTETVHDHGA